MGLPPRRGGPGFVAAAQRWGGESWGALAPCPTRVLQKGPLTWTCPMAVGNMAQRHAVPVSQTAKIIFQDLD